MPFHHDIENKIRFIVVYQDVSKKPTVIQKYTKIGLRNIQRWIKDTEENINILERRPGSGRRPSIPDNVKSNITRTTRRKPSKSSTRKLSNKYQVSKNSAHRVLKEKKYKYKKPKSGKTLTSEEKADRVDYCEYMLNRNGKRINACFFSDEMGITLSDAHPSRVWNPPRKKVNWSTLLETRDSIAGVRSLLPELPLFTFIREPLMLIDMRRSYKNIWMKWMRSCLMAFYINMIT